MRMSSPGGVAERLKAPVLKTGTGTTSSSPQALLAGDLTTNPTASAPTHLLHTCAREDPDLAVVVAAWGDLGAPIRAAIVTMARKLSGK